MSSPFDPKSIDEFPEVVPIFPLPGATLLPRTQLPLNIFEPRYLAMIFDALASHRCIAMVQPTESQSGDGRQGDLVPPEVYEVGCLGRITAFNETEDGRLLVNLQGLCRFRVTEELALHNGYRRVRVDWQPYAGDLHEDDEFRLDREQFRAAMAAYFDGNGIRVDWEGLDKMSDERAVNFLSMHLPFTPPEKQALLEAASVEDRNKVLLAVASMAAPEDSSPSPTLHH
jgi:Lon protease-like protein